jgi:hypothetical protein
MMQQGDLSKASVDLPSMGDCTEAGEGVAEEACGGRVFGPHAPLAER